MSVLNLAIIIFLFYRKSRSSLENCKA